MLKKRSDFSFSRPNVSYYRTLLENPTLGIQRFYRFICRLRS